MAATGLVHDRSIHPTIATQGQKVGDIWLPVALKGPMKHRGTSVCNVRPGHRSLPVPWVGPLTHVLTLGEQDSYTAGSRKHGHGYAGARPGDSSCFRDLKSLILREQPPREVE